jgi:hypothetical protein
MRVATEHYAWQGEPVTAEPIDGLMACIRAALLHAAMEFD